MRSTFVLLCLALVLAMGDAADPECSAQCGSEIGFVSSQGPELIVSYDGTELHVPGYCKLAQCGVLEQNAAQLKSGQQNLAQELSQAKKEIQDLKEEMRSMKAALSKLSSDVSSNANAINCGQGQKMNAVTKVCEACEAGTFKTADSHRETSCTTQTKCGQGQFISADSVKAARTCSACTANTYQSSTSHRNTECTTQITCGLGEAISADSTKAARKCYACPVDTYQAGATHRNSCTVQTTCGPGKLISADSATAARKCSGCPANTYQDATNHRTPTCKVQTTCSVRQKISADTKVAARTCIEQFVRGGHYGACSEYSVTRRNLETLYTCNGSLQWPMKHVTQERYPKWPGARWWFSECYTRCRCVCDSGLKMVALHTSQGQYGSQHTTAFTCMG